MALCELELRYLGPLCFLLLTTSLDHLEVFLFIGGLLLPKLLSFYPSPFVDADLRRALLAPYNFPKLNMFQHHVDLLQFGIVDDFQQADDVGVTDLLENGDLPLCLVFGRNGDSPKLALLGEALYDLDRNIVACLETSCQFDLAMDASAYFFDDLVLVYQLATGNKVLLDLSLVGSDLDMSAVVMTL